MFIRIDEAFGHANCFYIVGNDGVEQLVVVHNFSIDEQCGPLIAIAATNDKDVRVLVNRTRRFDWPRPQEVSGVVAELINSWATGNPFDTAYPEVINKCLTHFGYESLYVEKVETGA